MYSDDEGLPFGGGRSPTPPPRRGRSRSRDRRDESPRGRGARDSGGRGGRDGGGRDGRDGRDRGRDGGGRDGRDRDGGGRDARDRDGGGRDGVRGGQGREGAGKAGGRGRTTGRALPKLNSIHKGSISSVQSYGAFVRLGDGSEYKDGLLHISRLTTSGRVEQVEDVISQGDVVWVKVVEVKEEEGKYSLDMRYVGQKDGEDKDPNNTHLDAGGGNMKKGGIEPIRIGAIQATTCSKCGARGHMARECWSSTGTQYALLEEPPEAEQPGKSQGKGNSVDPALVKEALQYYLKRKAGEASSSSSSSSSSSKKKKKKEKKKKKKEKKKRKKEKKLEKKAKKKEKEQLQKAAQATKQPPIPESGKAEEGPAAGKAEEAKKAACDSDGSSSS